MNAAARRIEALAPAACAIAFAGFLAYTGVPALRHDWSWISGPGYLSNAWALFSGWRTDGFGSPRAYPTDYLLVVANGALVSSLGNVAAYVLNVVLIGYAAAGGAARLTHQFTTSRAAAAAAAVFATFNPWVYNEVVAGHIYMVLAYGGAMLLLSELFARRPSQFRVGVFALLTMGQLQFFLPALLALAGWTIVRRERPWALAVALVVALPVWIGLVADRGYLQTVPYILAWQNSASVDPISVPAMGGYFARYADALPGIVGVASWVVVALSIGGAVAAFARNRLGTLLAIVAYAAIWAFVSGTKGIFAGTYTWLVQHVVATGVYRELYDAVAFLAMIYVLACAALVARWHSFAWAWLACAAAFAAGWALVPPARYWVPSQMLPRVTITAPANTRYALMPPLQPISFDWGSGLDPDAVVLPHNVTPLNTQQFSDPESPALMRYAFTGDARELQALSVSEVVERPWYRTNVGSLRYQLALAPPRVPVRRHRNVMLHPLPELTLAAIPALSAIPQPLWRNAVFFADASRANGPAVPASWASAPQVTPVRAPSGAVSAAKGWVDARSAFVVLPKLSQGVGGTVTTDPHALLALDPTRWTLAFISGRLDNARGAVVAQSTHGYHWLPPLHARQVRCIGLCIVVAQSSAAPPARVKPHASALATGCSGAPAFRLPASWLLLSTLPASGRCLMRYNVRFDPHWLAFAGGTRLGHVAVDSIANGWIVPAHARAESLIVVQGVAGAQFAAEAFGILLLLAVGIARTAVWARARR